MPATFKVEGYPTLYFVTPSGKIESYEGGRTADDIVTYIRKHKETAGQAAATEEAVGELDTEPLKDEL